MAEFFAYKSKAKETCPGFKYFDTEFQKMKIRCMFYQGNHNVLYDNTDLIHVGGQKLHVQSLEFYYANANEKDAYYDRVEQFLNCRK